MDNFFETLIGFGLALVIGGIIAFFLHIARTVRNVRCFPNDEKKQELLQAIHKMRTNGANYEQRLTFLRNQGYTKDVADAFLGEAERMK